MMASLDATVARASAASATVEIIDLTGDDDVEMEDMTTSWPEDARNEETINPGDLPEEETEETEVPRPLTPEVTFAISYGAPDSLPEPALAPPALERQETRCVLPADLVPTDLEPLDIFRDDVCEAKDDAEFTRAVGELFAEEKGEDGDNDEFTRTMDELFAGEEPVSPPPYEPDVEGQYRPTSPTYFTPVSPRWTPAEDGPELNALAPLSPAYSGAVFDFEMTSLSLELPTGDRRRTSPKRKRGDAPTRQQPKRAVRRV